MPLMIPLGFIRFLGNRLGIKRSTDARSAVTPGQANRPNTSHSGEPIVVGAALFKISFISLLIAGPEFSLPTNQETDVLTCI